MPDSRKLVKMSNIGAPVTVQVGVMISVWVTDLVLIGGWIWIQVWMGVHPGRSSGWSPDPSADLSLVQRLYLNVHPDPSPSWSPGPHLDGVEVKLKVKVGVQIQHPDDQGQPIWVEVKVKDKFKVKVGVWVKHAGPDQDIWVSGSRSKSRSKTMSGSTYRTRSRAQSRSGVSTCWKRRGYILGTSVSTLPWYRPRSSDLSSESGP